MDGWIDGWMDGLVGLKSIDQHLLNRHVRSCLCFKCRRSASEQIPFQRLPVWAGWRQTRACAPHRRIDGAPPPCEDFLSPARAKSPALRLSAKRPKLVTSLWLLSYTVQKLTSKPKNQPRSNLLETLQLGLDHLIRRAAPSRWCFGWPEDVTDELRKLTTKFSKRYGPVNAKKHPIPECVKSGLGCHSHMPVEWNSVCVLWCPSTMFLLEILITIVCSNKGTHPLNWNLNIRYATWTNMVLGLCVFFCVHFDLRFILSCWMVCRATSW